MPDFNNCTALITGASSGFGEEFARQLAREAGTLILVARRKEKLEALASSLRQQHDGLKVVVLPCDLSEEQERLGLVEALKAQELEIDLLVNNAGLGDVGDVVTAEWAKLNSLQQVNMVALTHLTRALLPSMIDRGAGCVVNVSSSGGFLPLPAFAAYAASKAYVNSLSEALRFELKGTGVSVTVVCPGPSHTEFGQVAERPDGKRQFAPPSFAMLPAEQIVREAIAAARKGRARVIPGTFVRVTMLLVDAIPTPLLRGLLGIGDWVMTRMGVARK